MPRAGRVDPQYARVILLTFFLVQLLDGVLTSAGIRAFGPGAEGNVLVRTLIQAWGPGAGLASAKAFACLCGLILYVTTSHRILAATTGAHVVVAVVPWLLALA